MGSEGNLRLKRCYKNGTGKNKEQTKKMIEDLKREAKSADVVFLQETNFSERLNPLETDWNVYHTTGLRKRGVAILIRKRTLFHYKIAYFDDDFRYVVVKGILRKQKFILIIPYNPQNNDVNETPLKELGYIVELSAEGLLVIGRYFNTSLNPDLDRNSQTIRRELKSFMEDVLTRGHLVGVWRKLFINIFQSVLSNENIFSNCIFVLEMYMKYFSTCDISKDQLSDHIPVYFKINNENTINNPQRALMISKRDVANGIFEVFDKHAQRPDGRPLSYYLNNKSTLIEIFCEFFNRILDKPETIPDSFSKAIVVGVNYIFNEIYLILATIIAKKLYTLLESPSEGERGNEIKNKCFKRKKAFYFEASSHIEWDYLKSAIDEEMKDNKLTNILSFMLKTRDECKVLRQGCPLTPVLKFLYLKYVAIELIKSCNIKNSNIYISGEKVIAEFPVDGKCDVQKNIRRIKSQFSVKCSKVQMYKK